LRTHITAGMSSNYSSDSRTSSDEINRNLKRQYDASSVVNYLDQISPVMFLLHQSDTADDVLAAWECQAFGDSNSRSPR